MRQPTLVQLIRAKNLTKDPVRIRKLEKMIQKVQKELRSS